MSCLWWGILTVYICSTLWRAFISESNPLRNTTNNNHSENSEHIMESLFKEINEKSHLKPFVSMTYFNYDEKNPVESFDIVQTKYGDRVQIEGPDYKSFLPLRFVELFPKEKIDELNRQLTAGKTKIFFLSRGTVGQTTNIEFVHE